MDTDDDGPIVHLKDRNRYKSLDRRGPCSLDASELRIQDEIISSMDDKNNDVNKILLLMCVQLDEMMDDSDRIPDHLNRRSDAIDTLIKSRTFSSPSSSVDSVLTSKKPNQKQLSKDANDLIKDIDELLAGTNNESIGLMDCDKLFCDVDELIQGSDEAMKSGNLMDFVDEMIDNVKKLVLNHDCFHSSQQQHQYSDNTTACLGKEEEGNQNDYEDFLTIYGLILNLSLIEVDQICDQLIDLVGVRRSEWNKVQLTTKSPPKHRRIDDFSDAERRKRQILKSYMNTSLVICGKVTLP